MPVCKNEQDEDAGSITQHLALWCRKNGYDVELYTSDFELIDLSWRSLSKNNLLARLEVSKLIKTNPVLGRHYSQEYLQSYIDIIGADVEVHILPHMSGALISSLLLTSPIIACVNYNVLHSVGRQIYTGQNTSKTDDVGGKLSNHFVVLYGEDAQGNFLFTDSWKKPGRFVIEPEKLVCAITAAQIECDSIIFQIAKSDK